MQAAMDVAVPYVHTRKQFGQKIGEFQVSVSKKYIIYLFLIFYINVFHFFFILQIVNARKTR